MPQKRSEGRDNNSILATGKEEDTISEAPKCLSVVHSAMLPNTKRITNTVHSHMTRLTHPEENHGNQNTGTRREREMMRTEMEG